MAGPKLVKKREVPVACFYCGDVLMVQRASIPCAVDCRACGKTYRALLDVTGVKMSAAKKGRPVGGGRVA